MKRARILGGGHNSINPLNDRLHRYKQDMVDRPHSTWSKNPDTFDDIGFRVALVSTRSMRMTLMGESLCNVGFHPMLPGCIESIHRDRHIGLRVVAGGLQ